MAELSFETLAFKEEPNQVKVILLNQFYFYLKKEDLEQIAKFKINKHKITFLDILQNKAEKKFNSLLDRGFKGLKSLITNNPAIYIHQNSGIPLIGNVSFGLVYRNTSLIEIKPVTGCNLNCIYCSVGEGINSQKTDFVIEKDYLVQEFQKLASFAQVPIEAHIGTHGEPFLYGDIIPLVTDLNNLKQVHTVSVDTNGTLLNKQIIDQLKKLKKVRLNISLNTLNSKTASILAGAPYSLNKIIKLIKYAKNKVQILLTPLIVPSYNDLEIEDVVKFAKENNLAVGIQNFLSYKTGRNPVKPWSWEKFYSLLKGLEKKYQIKLIYSPKDFKIEYAKKLPSPFQLGDVVFAVIVSPDRFKNSRLAVAKGRTISIPDCNFAIHKRVQVKITRDKHNIFTGKIV